MIYSSSIEIILNTNYINANFTLTGWSNSALGTTDFEFIGSIQCKSYNR
jgi:hypothetical protein